MPNFEAFFWVIFETLPLHFKNELRLYWTNRNIDIFTDEAQIDAISESWGKIKWAATDGIRFYFRLETIQEARDLSLVRIIYHEIAHSLLFARGEFSILDYTEGRLAKIKQCEKATERIEKKWLRGLKSNRALIGKLRADSLVSEFLKNHCLTPI